MFIPLHLAMKKLILFTLYLSVVFNAYAVDRDFWLTGQIKESVGKTDLLKAMIILFDAEGNPSDTIKETKTMRYKMGEMSEISFFSIPVQRKDSTYVFDVACDGYMTQTVTYRVENVGKREATRKVPTVYLDRAPHKLGEVTVTASKIKFYNKGDTIVYNADAFQLAEGSMLDALIAQLPGAELNDDGQIKVNGEFVESLLLNGKKFLDGNNKLMLENIGAYTVKSVEVYKGQTEEEKWLDDPSLQKHLTMDVRLKREYNVGLIVNAQGGYGTEDRYTGRLFASWFNPTTRLTLLGNVNNLNDNRQPGKNDTWTPEMMPSGTKKYSMGGFNYDYEGPERDRQANGYLTFEQTTNNNCLTTARTNFLAGGDTYENSFDNSRNRETKIQTQHVLRRMKQQIMYGLFLKGRYTRKDNASYSVGATFDSEQKDITMKALEAIYSDGTPERLDAIINRSITRTDGASRDWEGQAFPNFTYKIPKSRDRMSIEIGVKYRQNKEERWRDHNINYGADPVPAYRRRQFFDNSPNHTLTLINNLTYSTRYKNFSFGLNYEYRFLDQEKDSYMYALDRLPDMGIFGVIPAGYLDSFDPANSYTSRLIENTHTLKPVVWYDTEFSNGNSLNILFTPSLALKHSHLDYWRDGRDYLVTRSDFFVKAAKSDIHIDLGLGRVDGKRKRRQFRNFMVYRWIIEPKTPNLMDMVDVVNDSDPLNITEGNPDLKLEYKHTHSLEWKYTPEVRHIMNMLRGSYSWTDDALTRGYVYNTSTGVRRIRTYNVNGNSSAALTDNFSFQFGSKDQFSLSSNTNANLMRYSDMIGVDLDEPALSKVRTWTLSEKLGLTWQIGQQSLQLSVDYTNRHTTSSREDFAAIDADHLNYGFIGQFRLPGGFGISTDFIFYSRQGYGIKELDTTDAIWNMRLTYCPPRAKKWVFMVDGFDMLRQLSNVNYAVNAAGRTVSYSNALPRYLLFSLQYRLNIQPKKR